MDVVGNTCSDHAHTASSSGRRRHVGNIQVIDVPILLSGEQHRLGGASTVDVGHGSSPILIDGNRVSKGAAAARVQCTRPGTAGDERYRVAGSELPGVNRGERLPRRGLGCTWVSIVTAVAVHKIGGGPSQWREAKDREQGIKKLCKIRQVTSTTIQHGCTPFRKRREGLQHLSAEV